MGLNFCHFGYGGLSAMSSEVSFVHQVVPCMKSSGVLTVISFSIPGSAELAQETLNYCSIWFNF